jgi:hypothetical protein
MVIPDTSLVLVCVLPGPRDLEIARLLGWYRIPLRTAPKVVDVDFLAFYQTAAFGESERWQVHYLAEVRGHELVSRAELFRDEPDHPRAHEEYYKIQLGPLITLAEPILAEEWKRLTFLYSTGAYLNNARTLNELVVLSDDREILWRSLRERAVNTSQYQTNNFSDIPTEQILLEWLGGLDLKISEDTDALWN